MLEKAMAVVWVEATVKVKVVPFTATEASSSKVLTFADVVSIPTIETKVETPVPEELKVLTVTDEEIGVELVRLKPPVKAMLLMTMLTLSAA